MILERVDLAPHGIEVRRQSQTSGDILDRAAARVDAPDVPQVSALLVDFDSAVLWINQPVEANAEARVFFHLLEAVSSLVARRREYDFDGEIRWNVDGASERGPSSRHVNRQIRLPPSG